ncbi:glutathionylspermidine synthase family protein [Halalkalibacter urbisdiaboli]|uniref:glutathionylspermidine synthase family protein n=1 Tax=Halalkalibacter urbisdiaboli TaxID=1960589 RepID=UPI0013FD83A9|nr:glutathionylspermidine synthase family protein [Halalkalibacter urbisdiaboli]
MEGNHKQARNHFYNKITDFWDRLYNQEYALFDCLEIEHSEVTEIRKATKEVYSIFKKINQVCQQAPDETLEQLGFPKQAFPFLRMKLLPYETVIGRFDFVKTKEGLKVIEFNSDTPTFIRELFEINSLVCKHFELQDPNDGEVEELGRAIRNSVYHCAKTIGVSNHPYVVFTAHEEDIEDRETMKFLMKVAQIKDSAFVPLHQLQIISEGSNKGVYDPTGKRISIVYRHTYPLEALLDDIIEDQFPIGIEFMKLVQARAVGMLNPVSAFLMQSKAVMALIWGMMEAQHSYFTEKDRESIRRYFLPTYLDEDPFIEKNEVYVSKPVFGREGNTVEVKDAGKAVVTQGESYQHYLKVYQKYVDLPEKMVKTENGQKKSYLLIGSFIINEKPSAFGFRAGDKITNNLSYFLPCGVKGAIT